MKIHFLLETLGLAQITHFILLRCFLDQCDEVLKKEKKQAISTLCMIEMWMIYRCFRKHSDTVVKPQNAELTEEEKQQFHSKPLCNSFLDKYNRCCLCEFPLEAHFLNDLDKPTRHCSRLDFVLRKENQFIKNVLSKEEISKSKRLNSLSSYYEAMRLLLRAYGCFYRQAEYPIVLNPEKVNKEYKEFFVNYMPDCSTEEHLHKKIQEFQCYKNSTITVRQKAFALMYSRISIFWKIKKNLFL